MPRKRSTVQAIPSRTELRAVLSTAQAILATSKVHAGFRATHEVGPCFDSDLKHDHNAIRATPDRPFVWIITPHSTHMAMIGAPDECLADTERQWRNYAPELMIASVTNGCLPADYLETGKIQLYMWDGSSLTRHATVDALRQAIARTVRERALAYVEEQRKPHAEDLALAIRDNMPSWRAGAERALERWDSFRESVEAWGPL